jgi:carboxypeptidase PM20D1
MKKVALALGILLLAVVAVITVNTIRFVPSPEDKSPVAPIVATNDSVLAEHLAGAVRIRTVSRQDSTPPLAELRELHAYLAGIFPRTHATLEHEVVGDANLLFKWAGSDTTLEPIVMMGHMDVVPVEAGSESAWTHPPFSGDIADGFIWGRGTMDDKVGVLSNLEAVESLIKEGYAPRRTVYLAFGDDEEVTGHGATDIIALLRARGVHPLAAFDEGGALATDMIPGTKRPVGAVAVAEKGYGSIELSVKGVGGHSSMPPRETAVGVLAHAIDQLEQNPFPAKMNGATAAMFDHVGRELAWPARMAMANLWLARPLVLHMLAKTPATDATVRTTTAPTMMQGSPKENVLPVRATAIVNFRIAPGDTPASVLARVKSVINDPRVEAAFIGTPTEPSPVSRTDTEPYRILARTIRSLEPTAIVAPILTLGATDSRHYAGYARNVYRFLPNRVGKGDVARVHGTDERTGVHDYALSVAFMTRLIRDLSKE